MTNDDSGIVIPLWKPKDISQTHMSKFMLFVNNNYSKEFNCFNDLYDWSVTDIKEFWKSVWEYCGIISSRSFDLVLEDLPMGEFPKWFLGSKLNYAENLLRFNDDQVALVQTGENGLIKAITYSQLHFYVAQCADALRKSGIVAGDRVVAYIPNTIDAVVAMLASTSIGAIWSSSSPDFGVNAVLDRFTQITPRILFSVNAVVYNGRTHDHLEKLSAVVSKLPTLEKVIIFQNNEHDFDVSSIPKAMDYHSFICDSKTPPPIIFEQLPFNHPAFILFSSGTTGKPKCIVHSAGGTLIQHLKEHVIHANMQRSDVFFYYTTTGWMMWNWLISGLSVGSTLILFDGSPFKPTQTILFDLVDMFKISVFGTSAKYIQNLESQNISPIKTHQLVSLRLIYSTGSPLLPENFDYVYKHISEQALLGSITGGTDIVSLFAGHNTNLSVHRGEIQSRCLGMAIESLDHNKKPIFDNPGELVCTKPFPCMPVFFWNDPKNEKYKAAYFSQSPNIWYHGDYVVINSKTQGLVMLGRSDGTLNPGGVRFGSSEIYNIMTFFTNVEDSLAVGQKIGDDERVILFCKMKPNQSFTSELDLSIRSRIRTLLSPRHVPSIIMAIDDIPYTLTGKKVEVVVKKIISGEKTGSFSSSTLVNPESLELFYNLPLLASKI